MYDFGTPEALAKYQAEIAGRTVEYEWHGNIVFNGSSEAVPFDMTQIDQSKSRLTRQVVSGENLEVGNVFSSELRLTLRDKAGFPISSESYNYISARIDIYFKLNYSDGTNQSVYIGRFFINEAERTYHTVTLIAYDNCNKFNQKMTQKFTGDYTPYQALTAVCQSCGVTFGMTEQELTDFPNYDLSDLKMSVYKKGTSFKEVLGNICTILGANAVANRDGNIVLAKYGSSSVRTIDAGNRYSSSYVDYIGRYNTICVVNKKGEIEEYMTLEPETEYRPLVMNIGKNTLLNKYTGNTRETIIRNILNYVYEIIYAPCNITMPCDPSLDCGDMVTITGGELEDDINLLCTKIEMPLFGQMKITSEAGSYDLETDPYATEAEQQQQQDNSDNQDAWEQQEEWNGEQEEAWEEQEQHNSDTDEAIGDMGDAIDSLATKMAVNYIFPYETNLNPISDGGSAYVMRFRFKCDRNGDTVSFYSMLSFVTSTTLASDNYSDCNLSVKYYVDNTLKSTAVHTYGDGNAILTLNGCFSELTAGDHTFDVQFSLSGGGIS